MPKQHNAFRLGLTVLVVVVLLFSALIFLGSATFESRVPIVVLVRHDLKIPRLKPGAPIVCGPQQVGLVTRVTTIERALPGDPPIDDYLFFEIHGQVNESLDLRADCRIAVEGQLLGDQGQLVIEHRGTDHDRVSPDRPIFAGATGFASKLAMITRQFDEHDPASLLSQIKLQLDAASPLSVMAKVHRILDDLNMMTTNLKHSVDPTRQTALITRLNSILDRIGEITTVLARQMEPGNEQMIIAKLHRNLDLLDQALDAALCTIDENRQDLRTTVQGVGRITDKLEQQIVPAVEQEVRRSNPQGLLARVHSAFDEINTALADVNVVTDKTRRVATLGEQRILALIRNAKEASDHLKAAAKDLRRNPWRLIHQPDQTESKQAYIFDAVREFAEASAYLDDSAAQLEALLQANRGRVSDQDPTLLRIRESLNAAFERFSNAEEALWSQLDVP